MAGEAQTQHPHACPSVAPSPWARNRRGECKPVHRSAVGRSHDDARLVGPRTKGLEGKSLAQLSEPDGGPAGLEPQVEWFTHRDERAPIPNAIRHLDERILRL